MDKLSKICITLLCAIGALVYSQGNYVIGTSSMYYDQAEVWCNNNHYGSNLASIHSVSDHDETKTLCENVDHSTDYGCWIGLVNNNGWAWNDGTSTNYAFNNNDGSSPTTGLEPWGSGQPNGYGPVVNLHKDATFLWITQQNARAAWPICRVNYVIGTSYMSSYEQAETYCNTNYGTHLASIHSVEANNAVKTLCESVDHTNDYGCWIGIVNNNGYSWSDGTSTNYAFNNNDGSSPTTGLEPWGSGQPNGYGPVVNLHKDWTFLWVAQQNARAAWPICNAAPLFIIATSEPTTSEPTTSVPTTSVPTTSNPTTSVPTTSTPTTSAPTTSAPTTSAPTTSAPTTSEPTTSNPTTSAPTTSAPTTSVPTTSVPTTSTPTTSEPTTSVPTTSAPTTSVPTTSTPTTSAPTTSVPTTNEPTTSEPTTSEPTTSAPTTSEPTTSNPTTSAPTTSVPTTSVPTTSAPTTSVPTTSAPTTSAPTTSNPTTSNPTTSNPTTSVPTYVPSEPSVNPSIELTLFSSYETTETSESQSSNPSISPALNSWSYASYFVFFFLLCFFN